MRGRQVQLLRYPEGKVRPEDFQVVEPGGSWALGSVALMLRHGLAMNEAAAAVESAVDAALG